MNITELISQYRREAVDTTVPYFLSDSEVIGLLNEAVDEACIRKRLLTDTTTADVAVIAVTAGTATYDLDESVVYVPFARLEDDAGDSYRLAPYDRYGIERIYPGWRKAAVGVPEILVVEENLLRLVPEPVADYTLYLEVCRVPLATERLGAGVAPEIVTRPVIAAMHHRYLVHWVVASALSRPDADLFNPGQAEKHEKLFEHYFGQRPDADRQRTPHHNRPKVNKLWN